jgi:GH15 family glucan-1,4-alpha-glucosidase
VAGRIEDYAIVGDMQSVALIGTDGSVDWLCLPRFDSEASFAALLGTQDHGHWRIAPTVPGTSAPTRRYTGDSLILETQWETPDGVVRVTDFMPPRDDEPPVLVRLVTGVSGTVDMSLELKIRFGYGSIVPWTVRTGDGIAVTAGPDSLWLRTPVPLTGRDLAHAATFRVAAGDSVPFVLTYLPSHQGEPAPLDPFGALEQTR